jgi:hypothetical protein
MSSPVKITRDLRVIAPPDAPPLTGAQLLELGKQCLQKGSVAVALEAVDRGYRLPRGAGRERVVDV